MKRLTTPAADGFHMPAEYEAHKATILIWPVRPGSWPYDGKEAKQVFAKIAKEIARSEEVYLLAAPKDAEEARLVFEQDEYKSVSNRIHVLPIETDDAWARDVGPTFVTNESGDVRGIDWEFNAWGGTYDGLYAHWKRDDQAASAICESLSYDYYDCHPFVLEGGSIHTDGEGTLLVTETCLLSPGRNPDLSKEEIERRLKEYLGVAKVIWLPVGIYHDETNEHVDNVCAFIEPGKVVLAWTDDETDPQYAMSKACLEVLSRERDAKERSLQVVKLPIPKVPVTVREEDLCGYEFEEGEDTRELGERLAASYVNFYITNDAVLVPQFGDVHDAVACQILQDCFPDRRIVRVEARAIIVGGGNIHCITQQIPKGR